MWTEGWGKSEFICGEAAGGESSAFFHAGWATLKLSLYELAYYNNQPSLSFGRQSIPLHLSEDL